MHHAAKAGMLTLLACAPARAEDTAQVGKPAPNFTLADTDGKPVNLAALLGKTG